MRFPCLTTLIIHEQANNPAKKAAINPIAKGNAPRSFLLKNLPP
jgi:hypothetical protein